MEALDNDEKNRAEKVMIADLMRYREAIGLLTDDKTIELLDHLRKYPGVTMTLYLPSSISLRIQTVFKL